MKEAFVQFPTYEVAHALDENLLGRAGDEFSSKDEPQRLVSILLALEELGAISTRHRGRETWFFIEPDENQASDVIRVKLKSSIWLRSVALSKFIMPMLGEAWQTAAGLDRRPVGPERFEVEIDPFVSQLARWVDKEVTAQRPELKSIFRTERLAEVCVQLQRNGVAIRTGTEGNSRWATPVTIDNRIGGAKISHDTRFSFVKSAEPAMFAEFQAAVRENLSLRLITMLETEEAFFSLCNEGEIKIAFTDPDGHYHWDLVEASSS
ncbi:hypothetical protein [Bradyrhizobium sp. CCGUVB14]|uniref:hypothetical protein n=1 Tax=Bradyrhizobium sp. CCGUVB14 TaxID=2949628 RepID=UPI0020B2C0D1|nr:hypothetical protein [Bradyrhizobium sp. CCGUVB14]MCP3441992.1 hypothetical protein [Bradyrhizobium sp. CCGUVB14]